MVKQKFHILLLIAFVACIGCNQSNPSRKGVYDDMSVEYASETAKSASLSEEVQDARVVAKAPAQPRKIIRRGTLRFETSHLGETNALITQRVQALGGYVEEEAVYHRNNRTEHRMTLRLPAGQFDAFLAQLAERAKKVDEKNISSQDVTEEFVDIEARIKTKKALENRYKEILTQAKSVEDILRIEKEIGTLRSEIESIEGRLNYLNDRVEFSSLTLFFYEQEAAGSGFGLAFVQALKQGWSNLLWFFISLTYLWPFLIIGAVAVGLLVVRRKRIRQRKANEG